MEDFFVLGIGGTGMRCIESLVHLCAMGMFDNTNIHLLALDTDQNNGNFGRLKEVVTAYNNTKGIDETKRTVLSDTFFSANIHYYEFSPNYQTKSSFKAVFNYAGTQFSNRPEADLADLVFDSKVEEFNLSHGYRAQTHLGSMMMYHSILEDAKSNHPSSLKDYLRTLTTASQQTKPRVFILGSVFGGTGASSIPIIPQAINDAAAIVNGGAVNILQSAYFGSTLLTSYFTFTSPSENQITQEKVIASSDKFALNSQVAMKFYNDDPTVRSTYQRFYMMGTPTNAWNPMDGRKSVSNATITGGAEQRNDSHYIELLAACAAYDFFKVNEAVLQTNKSQVTTDYLYRAVRQDGVLEFKDFVSQNEESNFALRFGTLIALYFLCNGDDDFVENVRNGGHKDIQAFRDMDANQVIALKDYFRLFYANCSNGGEVVEGWLRQLHRSAGGGNKFLFNAKLFSPNSQKELSRFDWNKNIFSDDRENAYKDYRFSTGIGTKFNKFKTEFLKKMDAGGDYQNITNSGEQLYKLIYDTLRDLYKHE